MTPAEQLTDAMKFLTLTLERQARDVLAFIQEPAGPIDGLILRRDRIDGLKVQVENDCYAALLHPEGHSKKTVGRLRAMQMACHSLERLNQLLVEMTRKVAAEKGENTLSHIDVTMGFEKLISSLSLFPEALKERSMDGAMALCKAGPEMNALYAEAFKEVVAKLSSGDGFSHGAPSALGLLHALERVGSELLHLGEAVLFAVLGERIRIHHFEALQKTLKESGVSASVADIQYQAILGNRSGCRVGVVEVSPDAEAIRGSIYKEGPKEKIAKEVASIKRWQSLFPGLVPSVYSTSEKGDHGTMLVEYLPGVTLDRVLVSADDSVFSMALATLTQTLESLWSKTLAKGGVKTDYMGQIRSRLNDVTAVHDHGLRPEVEVCGAMAPSMLDLMASGETLEGDLAPPFSIWIHGDFNINNLVYNPDRSSLHYIDLHRSKEADFLQDASVCLVSCFRMPLFERRVVSRINGAVKHLYGFSKRFASEHGDAFFEARMALALARSFFTSTRFELNKEFSMTMRNRAIFLLEKVASHGGRLDEFRLPEEVLYR